MTNEEIQTGVEYESDVDHPDAEIYGYVDDGEHATVYAVWSEPEYEHYAVAIHACEAGLVDKIGRQDQPMDKFDSVKEVAEYLVERNPEADLEGAREHWNEK